LHCKERPKLRVLLTGHLGYLGTRLAPLLRAAGHEVVGFDSGLFRDCSVAPVEAVPAIEKDIRDAEPQDVRGFDAVIHLAALSNEELGQIHPALTFEINFEAAVRLAELAKQAGVGRFLFASSTSVYGAGSMPRGERDRPAPQGPYAVSKALAEEELAKLASDSFSPVFLRAAHPYGVSPMMRFEPALNRIVAEAAIDSRIWIDGDPRRRIDLVHVEDLARAFLAALEAPRSAVHGQAVNVGAASERFAIEELADIVSEIVAEASIEFQPEAHMPEDEGPAKFGKIARKLADFRTRWTARRGAVEIFELASRLALRRSDIAGARFGRMQHLRMSVRMGRLDDELRRVRPARLSALSGAG
jgi:nucleoside-diphosphate-sugar epimerase